MSYKTDRLITLFPDAYAAKDPESLLYRLLDAIAAELMAADEAIKGLLKSHWVDYASGKALDGLGAIYGVSRRRLRDETIETDDAFRQRLKSVVPLFTGGGTKRAIIGAVRSALGLPFDLDQLNLPDNFRALREDLEKLVYIEEFSPTGERVVNRVVKPVALQEGDAVRHASEMLLGLDIPTIREERPTIQWKFTIGAGRLISLELLPQAEGNAPVGVQSTEELIIPKESTLTLSTDPVGNLRAVLGLTDDVTRHFTNLNGTTPAVLPQVPVGPSEWRFRAQGGLFDISVFDEHDTFDPPEFEVEMNWLRYQPLTFDVHVPYFLQEAVEAFKALRGYKGKLFVFEGLPLEAIVEVVNQTRAAGVRGSVQFSLNFLEIHNPREALTVGLSLVEDAKASDRLSFSGENQMHEHHNVSEAFAIGGVFDISHFDEEHGFL
ncbi:hypothetical protein HYR99_35520 [Candidatus Poribacteria bacterium]|nr:hypothetical protein [Candidatus Poribacteria bacterium]